MLLAVVLGVVVLIALAVWAAVRWRGVWRILAVLPLVAWGFAAFRIEVDTNRSPRAHSLWPFELLFMSVLGVVLLGSLSLLRLVAGKTSGHAIPRPWATGAACTVSVAFALYVWISYALYARGPRVAGPHPPSLDPSYRLAKAEARVGAADGDYERWVSLGDAALLNAEVGSIGKATAYAEELLRTTEKYPDDWNTGNAIHKGHLALGLVALKSGDTEGARTHLLKSAIRGSPQLASFGPNMVLAKELLERGERDVVLEYLELCAKFWEGDHGLIHQWKDSIAQGSIPDFGANLLY